MRSIWEGLFGGMPRLAYNIPEVQRPWPWFDPAAHTEADIRRIVAEEIAKALAPKDTP